MAKIDRPLAEIVIKKNIIKHGKEYQTKALYEECRKYLVWTANMCKEEEFMNVKSFREWLKTFKWLEGRQITAHSVIVWQRCDYPSNELSALGKLVAKGVKFVIGGRTICRK